MFKGKKLSERLSDRRVVRAALIVGVAAILLIGLTSFIHIPRQNELDADAYAERTEERLLDIVTSISGVGEAEIFLTMDNSGENVYLQNSDTKTVSIEPKVRGVVVVCEGGDDPVVVSRVMEAVTKALDISSDKVCVTR